MNRLIDDLDRLYYLAGNRLSLPLLSFVARLSDLLGNPHDVSGWLEQLNEWLAKHAIISEHIVNASHDIGPAATEQTPYLMIELAPQPSGNTYQPYCYWQDGRGDQQPISTDEEEISPRDVPGILETILNKVEGPRPYLEFFLPEELLTENQLLDRWEQWAPGSRLAGANDSKNAPLGVEYPLSLRCWERLRKKEKHKQCGYDHLKDYWDKHKACLDKSPTEPHVRWLKTADGHYIHCLHKGALFIGLHFPPNPNYLHNLLDRGTAIALWPRQENLSQAMHGSLCDYMSVGLFVNYQRFCVNSARKSG